MDGISFSAPLLYRHSFLKKGRTISLNLIASNNKSEGNNELNSITTFTADSVPDDSLSQVSDLNSDGWNYSSELVYTEPIGAKSQLSLSYRGNLNNNSSEKNTYVYSPIDELFNILDTGLSNNFKSRYLSQSGGVNYRLQGEKMEPDDRRIIPGCRIK